MKAAFFKEHGGAEKILYDALSKAVLTARKEPIDVFESALRNATPLLEV